MLLCLISLHVLQIDYYHIPIVLGCNSCLKFKMGRYTPQLSVTIYPFNSWNVTRCTPTCLSRLFSIPGTGFSSELFCLFFTCLFFFFVVCVPTLWAFKYPRTVGYRSSRYCWTMYSSNPYCDVYPFSFITTIHVLFYQLSCYCMIEYDIFFLCCQPTCIICEMNNIPTVFFLLIQAISLFVSHWICTVPVCLDTHSMYLFNDWIMPTLPPCLCIY